MKIKRSLFYLTISLLAISISYQSLESETTPTRKKITLTGPPATVTFPLIYMMEKGYLKNLADEVEFKLWMNPDQLRAYALNQEADFLAMPSNVAANLYNKKVPVKLVNISNWGILWMVSRGKARKSIRDFKGEEIVMPFHGDMPDVVFRILVEKDGMDIRKDFKIRYVSNPMDAMQLMIMRRADHVVLAEPAISMALRKTSSYPLKAIAPELVRSLDLQKEWGRVWNQSDQMPQAGIVALGDKNTNPTVVKEFQKQYTRATEDCIKNSAECARLVANHIKLLSAEAIEDSLKINTLRSVEAKKAKKDLETFYKVLLKSEPNLIGGRMPDSKFYE